MRGDRRARARPQVRAWRRRTASSSNQVSLGRSSQRAEAARKRAKNRRSGRPRFAADVSPGIAKANEKFVKTSRCWSTITFVGPRHTEYASTQGMIRATSTTQFKALEVPQEPEADGGDAEELAEVLRRVPAGDVKQKCEHAERETHPEQSRHVAQREHEPHECEAGRNQDERDEGDVPPRRRVPQPVVECVVEGERRPEY